MRSIDERVRQFQRFYERGNERPLLGFFLGSEYPLHRYDAARALPDGRPLAPEDVPVEPYLDDCDRLFGAHEACSGDFIWSACAFWGIPWLEAALGCPIRADHTTGSAYAEPPPDFDGPDSIPEFDADAPWNAKTVEFINKIAERSAGRYPLATTRMRGVADLLSALYGGEQFLFAMMERPGEVKAVCERLTDFFIAYARLQLDHIPEFHAGIGSFYYSMWAPAGTVWHQEDAAALLSPALYDEFIRPCDERIVAELPSVIMHLHSTGHIPLDAYLDMGFAAIELHVDEGGPSAEELYETHMKILERTPLLIWGDMTDADMEWIFTKLPGQGLAVNKVVRSADEAQGIWEKRASLPPTARPPRGCMRGANVNREDYRRHLEEKYL